MLRSIDYCGAMPTYTAEFSHSAAATSFYDRLTSKPADYYALDIKRNRKGGRIVTWDLDTAARDANIDRLYADADPDVRDFGMTQKYASVYLMDMAETVGYDGNSPDGSKWSTLNGVHTPTSY
jgi:hypothetical protein